MIETRRKTGTFGKAANGGLVNEDQAGDAQRGDIRLLRPQPRPSDASQPHAVPETVTFDRAELRDILNLYGRKVAEGEWRDYAIDFTREKAVFSIFRRASEYPLYRIEKNPKLARKQGAFSVSTTAGLVLKRGQELKRVIEVLDKRLKLVTT
jgi:hypothetical protein